MCTAFPETTPQTICSVRASLAHRFGNDSSLVAIATAVPRCLPAEMRWRVVRPPHRELSTVKGRPGFFAAFIILRYLHRRELHFYEQVLDYAMGSAFALTASLGTASG